MRSFLSRCAAASVYFGAIPRAGQRVIRHLPDSNVTVRLFFLSQMWIGREPVAIFRNQNSGQSRRVIVWNRAKASAKRSESIRAGRRQIPNRVGGKNTAPRNSPG